MERRWSTTPSLDPSHTDESGSFPLSDFPILRHLDKPDVVTVLASSVSRSCRQGQMIRPLRIRGGTIGAVRRGNVRLSIATAGGRELGLFYRPAGDLFSLSPLDSPGATYVEAVAAAASTELSLFPAGPLLQRAASQPQAAYELVALLWHRLEAEERVLAEIFGLSVRARLAGVLVELANGAPGHVVRVTHSDLAIMVGTTREEVTKILRDFRAGGWIAHSPHTHKIFVSDIPRLLHESGRI